MKKVRLIALFCLMAAGCSKKQPDSGVTYTEPERIKPVQQTEKGLLDLDKLSKTMLFAEIFDMTISAEKYLGKKVHFSGNFMITRISEDSEPLFSVVQYDETACCQTGLQFMVRGDKKYPEDYPEEMAQISVTGVYSYMEKDGFDYFYIDCEKIDLL